MQAVILLNMKPLRERLLWALTRKGMSQSELARQVGVSRGAVSLWLKGGDMNAQNCAAVASTLDVDAEWLATGKGSPERKRDGARENTPSDHSGLTRLDKNTGMVTILRYDTGGSMGTGTLLRDQPGIIERLDVSREWLEKNVRGYTAARNLCVVTGFGDSMKPMFNPGDPLIVDAGVKTIEFDAVYFFRVGDEGFIKRLQRIPGKGLLAISENQAYRDWVIDTTMDLEVFGRVLKVWRSEDF